MSGRATVVGFTVNHHQWLPGFEPPYVIANVALDEDPTRPPHHQHRRLRARRRAHRPGGRGALRAARGRVAPAVRADRRRPTRSTASAEPQPPDAPRRRSATDRFEHRSVLSGIGRSAIGRRLMVDPLSLAVDACLAAVADAGLELDDIDGLSTYPGPVGHGHERGRRHRRRGGAAASARPGSTAAASCPGPGGSVIAAMLAVASGLCRHVLCFRTVWESTLRHPAASAAAAAAARVSGAMHGVARAVRRDVGGQLDRHERQPVPPPLRRHPRDARLHRAQRPGQRRPATRPRSTATR